MTRRTDLTDDWHKLKPGEYCKSSDGVWYASTPNGHAANLVNHEVVEHEDGTITVSPSISVTVGLGKDGIREVYHGFLEHGVWRLA